jgi:hypothetical protein
MKVLCVRGSRFLIKGEWYKVILSSQSFQLENHTDIKWNTSWYNKNNFATIQELREYKLKQIGIENE